MKTERDHRNTFSLEKLCVRQFRDNTSQNVWCEPSGGGRGGRWAKCPTVPFEVQSTAVSLCCHSENFGQSCTVQSRMHSQNKSSHVSTPAIRQEVNVLRIKFWKSSPIRRRNDLFRMYWYITGFLSESLSIFKKKTSKHWKACFEPHQADDTFTKLYGHNKFESASSNIVLM